MAGSELATDRSAPQRALFYAHLRKAGLKRTQQRELILETFLSADHHVNVDELIRRVREVDPTVGYSTVYRTVKLFLECGIAQEVRLADETRRLEPIDQDQHHDHLICVKCGQATEFFNCHLEMAQKQVASAYGFKPIRHSLKIYGTCRECQLSELSPEPEPPA